MTTRCGIVAIEEDEEKIAENYLANFASVENNHIAFNSVTADECGQMWKAAPILSDLPIRIIDSAFHKANCHPIPKLETNSFVNLFSNVRLMGLASIMPEYFSEIPGPIKGLAKVPLVEPEVDHAVGAITISRQPISPHVQALFAAARRFKAN